MLGNSSRLTLQLPAAAAAAQPVRRRGVLHGGLAGVASLGTLGLAACNAGRQRPPVEPASLRLSWIKNTEFAGFFAALDKGYYQDEGIDLTINGAAQNLSTVQAVATKADTIGLSGGQSLMLARAQGIPVKAFGALFQRGPGCFLWLARSGIRDLQDFKGKKLGLQQDARASTEAMLTMNSLRLEDVSLVTVGFDVQPLLTGQVDILTGLLTNQVVLLEQQGEPVGFKAYADLGFNFYWNTPFVLDETLRLRQNLLVAWLRASARGWDYALKHPQEIAKLVVEKYGEGLDLTNQTLELQREAALIRTEVTAQRGLFWMDPAVWQAGHEILLTRTKQLEGPLNLGEVYTLEILNKVGKGL